MGIEITFHRDHMKSGLCLDLENPHVLVTGDSHIEVNNLLDRIAQNLRGNCVVKDMWAEHLDVEALAGGISVLRETISNSDSANYEEHNNKVEFRDRIVDMVYILRDWEDKCLTDGLVKEMKHAADCGIHFIFGAKNVAQVSPYLMSKCPMRFVFPTSPDTSITLLHSVAAAEAVSVEHMFYVTSARCGVSRWSYEPCTSWELRHEREGVES